MQEAATDLENTVQTYEKHITFFKFSNRPTIFRLGCSWSCRVGGACFGLVLTLLASGSNITRIDPSTLQVVVRRQQAWEIPHIRQSDRPRGGKLTCDRVVPTSPGDIKTASRLVMPAVLMTIFPPGAIGEWFWSVLKNRSYDRVIKAGMRCCSRICPIRLREQVFKWCVRVCARLNLAQLWSTLGQFRVKWAGKSLHNRSEICRKLNVKRYQK